MSVANQKEIQADLGEIAEAGIHLPDPTDALSNVPPEEDHDPAASSGTAAPE